jgi:drug/metabolite transporter (DMT)-like permease
MTFVFIKEGVSIINLYNFIFYRFVIAAVVLGIIFFHRFNKLSKSTVKYGVILSIPLALTYITQTIGIQFTTASNSAFITGLSVVLVPIFLAIINKKLPKFNNVIAVILATVGLGILTLSSSLKLNIGDIWTFATAVSFAFYIIMVGKYTKKFDSVMLTFIQLISVGIIAGIISVFTAGFAMPQGYLVWQAIIFTSVFATSFVYVIQNHFQKFISEVKAAIIFSFEPLFAAVTAYFYLNEQITLRIIIGGLLILVGMLFSEIKFQKGTK